MTRPFLIALLCCLTDPAAYCQKTEKYFDYQWRETVATHARFYSIIEKTDSGWRRRDYYLHSLTLRMEGLYTDSSCKIPSGHFRYIHPTRVAEETGAYRGGRKQGLWLCYYSDGLLSDSTVYDNGNPAGIRTSWYRNGYIRDSASYNPDGSGIHIGWFANGNPSFTGRYSAGYKKYGKWTYFYKAGGTSATEVYDAQGRLQEKRFFDEKGAPLADTSGGDRAPSFPGGESAWSLYLSRSLYLPAQNKPANGDEATVVIEATIGEDGRVADTEVKIPFYPAFDKIALEAVQHSPGWLPGIDHHRPVQATVRLSVTFRGLSGQ